LKKRTSYPRIEIKEIKKRLKDYFERRTESPFLLKSLKMFKIPVHKKFEKK